MSAVSRVIAKTLRRGVADPDIAIDLGTANTRVCARHIGIIERPSLLDEGRTYSPLREGVVMDSGRAAEVLAPLIQRTRRGLLRPRALACVPTDASPTERSALIETVRSSGASSVIVAVEPLAAAIGAGIDVGSAYGHMLVDIGEGVTDMAIIRCGLAEASHATRVACGDIQVAVRRWVQRKTGVVLPWSTVSAMVHDIDWSPSSTAGRSRSLTGNDEDGGQERYVYLQDDDVRGAALPIVDHIIGAIAAFFHDLPSSLACEVIEQGIYLTGGGALLRGLRSRIASMLGIEVVVPANPLHAVIRGARQMLFTAADLELWEG